MQILIHNQTGIAYHLKEQEGSEVVLIRVGDSLNKPVHISTKELANYTSSSQDNNREMIGLPQVNNMQPTERLRAQVVSLASLIHANRKRPTSEQYADIKRIINAAQGANLPQLRMLKKDLLAKKQAAKKIAIARAKKYPKQTAEEIVLEHKEMIKLFSKVKEATGGRYKNLKEFGKTVPKEFADYCNEQIGTKYYTIETCTRIFKAYRVFKHQQKQRRKQYAIAVSLLVFIAMAVFTWFINSDKAVKKTEYVQVSAKQVDPTYTSIEQFERETGIKVWNYTRILIAQKPQSIDSLLKELLKNKKK